MRIVKHIVMLTLVTIGLVLITSGRLSAHVERTYFLKGKVGNREMAVKMLCYDEMPTRHIHYFFQDEKKDRYLAGKVKENFWNFIADEQNSKSFLKPDGTLHIVESTNGSWKGAWIDSSGKSWDIILKPIIPDSIPSPFSYLPYVTELDPYERYRVSNIHFKKINTEKLTKELLADWYVEKESGISFFQLRSNKLKTDSMNATLVTMHLSLIQKYFAYNPDKLNSKVETRFLYLSNELVSFQILLKTTLKNLTISQTRQLSTLDIRSGLEVTLEDLIWLDKSETKPDLSDLFKIYKYRRNIFAPKVFSLLQQLYPDKMKTDSCDINKMETWALPAWSLTNKGIALSFRTFDHCDVFEWAIMPYEKLEPFMEKRYHLMTKR